MSKKYKRKYKTNEGRLVRIHLNKVIYERNKKQKKYY